MTHHGKQTPAVLLQGALALTLAMSTLLCAGAPHAGATPRPVINAVGAENEYANVLSQIGGKFVHVSSVLSNPNVDPHTFEADATVAEEVSHAGLIVQNGVGYDGFMNDIESASPNAHRDVIVAQHVLGLPDSTANPHLWYSPKTMPAVAAVIARDLTRLLPGHESYFANRLHSFDASLAPWFAAIAAFKKAHRGTPVATTEPVADYLLSAMGMTILTPRSFEADVMNGVDPSPQGITLEQGLLTARKVKVFCFNNQVVDALTNSLRHTARTAGVPVVGVYETMPTPGYDYQNWMLAEVAAIRAAVLHKTSTERL